MDRGKIIVFMINLTIHNPHQFKDIPTEEDFLKWLTITLKHPQSLECGFQIVDEIESAKLNEQFRHKANPTNVLAFPCDEQPVESLAESSYLGDLAFCAPLIAQEAKEQQKPLLAHWAHLTIHGTLHLLGFDHQTIEEAHTMEQLEINTLAQLGYENPYD